MVSRIGREIELSPVEMGSRLGRNVKINMASGSPDPSTIPVDEIGRAYEEVLADLGPRSLFYPGAGGQQELIEEVNKYLPAIGLRSKDPIVITSGAQHAIELLSKYFLENGTVVVENPTFVETFSAFKLRASVTIPVTVDGKGISTDELELVTKIVKPDLVYVIPDCHNPAGVNLNEERRKILVELAEERDFYVIEDDPYRPIAGCVPAPLKNYDRSGRVIHVSSFSKILAPGLRIGFVVAPPEIAEKLSLMEQLDFSTSTLNQYVVSRLLRSGFILSRTKILPEHYRKKMKVLVDSLTDAGISEFNQPSCGFFLLLDLKRDAHRVLEEAVRQGLAFVPAKDFFLRGGETMARLSITVPNEEQIKAGVEILKRVIRG
ncbi:MULTISPECIES: PLP-dependent aminotransferase family protein [Metallosphaera]|uniref:GntR family transcriptional regulator n=3 Tax=Metallosphaera TaxID=41980 RepID=A0A088E1M4_9CREN|nr:MULTISPECIES: PLP-dependent aminotransferase family protein [Metallosphaera]ABP94367.1 putative transcriptional regulator, GntR family [Metallosphaera sedula DSM 5348]AIM26354.1 putative transcriptional regulator, GntR family [Metallosphaera sedula]AKV73363.1 GntR family transcriptional regulator [Metallosphaera sedula]AKV75607.1 GntR family transcriptional regulator [Metallosphaera sedula]AKV77853.1 GntR family transcriptional regulator [Metallosphaera sedula]